MNSCPLVSGLLLFEDLKRVTRGKVMKRCAATVVMFRERDVLGVYEHWKVTHRGAS